MPNGSVIIAGYTITLESVDCDELNQVQTWTYKVDGEKLGPGQEISNWALQLGDCANVIEPIIPPTDPVGPPGSGEGDCLNTDNCGNNVTNRIKWDGLSDAVLPQYFTFTTNPCYTCEPVQVAIKAGPDCHCDTILGPSLTCEPGDCDPEPPCERGLIL